MSDLLWINQGDSAYWVPQVRNEPEPDEGTKRNGLLIAPSFDSQDGRQVLKVTRTDFVWTKGGWLPDISPEGQSVIGHVVGRLSADAATPWEASYAGH